MEKEVVEKLDCSWKEANDMIAEARTELQVAEEDDSKDAEETRQRVMKRVTELWEERKPSDEEKSAKKKAFKDKQKARIESEEKQRDVARKIQAKEKDAAFRRNFLRCITCGLALWCTKGSPFNKDGEDVAKKVDGAETSEK